MCCFGSDAAPLSVMATTLSDWSHITVSTSARIMFLADRRLADVLIQNPKTVQTILVGYQEIRSVQSTTREAPGEQFTRRGMWSAFLLFP